MEVKPPKEAWKNVEGNEKGVVVNWFKSEGAKVEKDEEIAEIEVIKTSMTVKAPTSGTIKKIHVKEGEEFEQEASLATIE